MTASKPTPPAADSLDTTNLPPKRLAVPTSGKIYTFDELAGLALVSALFGSSVCILCLTQEKLEPWQTWLDQLSDSNLPLQVLNANERTFEAWALFFSRHACQVMILSGAYTEIQAKQLSVEYLKAFVKAVPVEMIVLA